MEEEEVRALARRTARVIEGGNVALAQGIEGAIRTALARSKHPDVGGEWREIESAPRDGTRVLLARHVGQPWGWVRAMGEWVSVAGIEGWVPLSAASDPPGVLGLGDPTHWMPLRAPPLNADEG